MKLFPRINVQVNPDFFIFSNDELTFTVPTLVGVRIPDMKIASVGEKVQDPAVLTVSLFADEQLPPEIDKVLLCRAFIEYNVAKFFVNRFPPILKLNLIFHDDQSLSHVLCGYQRIFLEAIAFGTMVREVRFD